MNTYTYFAPLVLLDDIITEPGKYVTRIGEIVTINSVSKRHDLGCRGHYQSGMPERWHKSGRIFANVKCDNDIVGRPE